MSIKSILPQTHNNYAVLLKKQGRPLEAEEQYQQALKLNPDYATAHNNYAILLNKQGRPQEASEHFRRARELGLSDISSSKESGDN